MAGHVVLAVVGIGRVGFEISMLIRKYSIAYKLSRSQIRIPLGTLLRAYKRFFGISYKTSYFISYMVYIHAYFMSYIVLIYAYFMSYIVFIHAYFMSYIVLFTLISFLL